MPGFLQHAAAFQALSFHAVTSIPAVSVKRASLRKSFPQTQNLTDAVKKPPQPTTESLISKCSVRLQPGNRQHLCCWRVEKPASHSLRFLGVYFKYLSSCLSEEVLNVGARSPVLPQVCRGRFSLWSSHAPVPFAVFIWAPCPGSCAHKTSVFCTERGIDVSCLR